VLAKERNLEVNCPSIMTGEMVASFFSDVSPSACDTHSIFEAGGFVLVEHIMFFAVFVSDTALFSFCQLCKP